MQEWSKQVLLSTGRFMQISEHQRLSSSLGNLQEDPSEKNTCPRNQLLTSGYTASTLCYSNMASEPPASVASRDLSEGLNLHVRSREPQSTFMGWWILSTVTLGKLQIQPLFNQTAKGKHSWDPCFREILYCRAGLLDVSNEHLSHSFPLPLSLSLSFSHAHTLPLSQSVFLTLSFHFSPSLPPPLPSSLPLLLPVLSLSLSFFLRLCYDRPKTLIPYNSEQNMPW